MGGGQGGHEDLDQVVRMHLVCFLYVIQIIVAELELLS